MCGPWLYTIAYTTIHKHTHTANCTKNPARVSRVFCTHTFYVCTIQSITARAACAAEHPSMVQAYCCMPPPPPHRHTHVLDIACYCVQEFYANVRTSMAYTFNAPAIITDRSTQLTAHMLTIMLFHICVHMLGCGVFGVRSIILAVFCAALELMLFKFHLYIVNLVITMHDLYNKCIDMRVECNNQTVNSLIMQTVRHSKKPWRLYCRNN